MSIMKQQQKDLEIIGFDDRLFRLIGIPVLAFFIPILFFDAAPWQADAFFRSHYIASLLFTSVYWQGGRWIIKKVRQRFNKQDRELKRVLISLGLVTIFTFIFGPLLGSVLYFIPGIGVEEMSFFETMVGSLSTTYIIIGIYEVFYFYQKWKQALLEQERFKRLAVQSQLDGLKSQVNPHFLFNCLNTLSTIIPESPERSVNFVQKLAKVYRYILEIRDRELISLEEELAFLQNYVFLLKERFEDNLTVEINVPSASYRQQLMPLSLQMLVENAIKHNIISDQHPLHIRIELQENNLVVSNDLQLKTNKLPSTRLGLKNIRDRYRFFTDREVDVISDQQHFLVKLPLLEINS
jgi:two-component system LytT family sensor kinase